MQRRANNDDDDDDDDERRRQTRLARSSWKNPACDSERARARVLSVCQFSDYNETTIPLTGRVRARARARFPFFPPYGKSQRAYRSRITFNAVSFLALLPVPRCDCNIAPLSLSTSRSPRGQIPSRIPGCCASNEAGRREKIAPRATR